MRVMPLWRKTPGCFFKLWWWNCIEKNELAAEDVHLSQRANSARLLLESQHCNQPIASPKLLDFILFSIFPLWLLQLWQLKPWVLSAALLQLSPHGFSSSCCSASPPSLTSLTSPYHSKGKTTSSFTPVSSHTLFSFLNSFLGRGSWTVTLSQEVFEICLRHIIERNVNICQFA